MKPIDCLKRVERLKDGTFLHTLRIFCYKMYDSKIDELELFQNLQWMSSLGFVFDIKVIDKEFISYKTMSWGETLNKDDVDLINDLKEFMNSKHIFYQAYTLDYFVKDIDNNILFRFPEMCFLYKDESLKSGDVCFKMILKRTRK